MNSIDENRQLNNIKNGRFFKQMMVMINIFCNVYNKNIKRNTIHIDLLHCVDEDSNVHFVYKGF